ncbi:MAG: BlaI/MecI/CopY family transcriptional regulator [Bacteroidales bacterium]|nr:BlaI/MecI/CopY family transcriptional regulator [Bacteroidales bacterium]
MKELTKAEEQVMHVLWEIEKGFVNDILEHFPDPKPAYNTISTVVRILEKKGFVSHKAYGKTHEYYPLVSKKDYTSNFFRGFLRNYFSNSYEALATFLANDKNVSINDLEEMKKLMEEEIQKQKSQNNE